MSQRPEYRGDHYWGDGDIDYWDPQHLPVEDRPAIGYIPENFRGPSLAHDNIDLGKFTKGNVAHVPPDPSRRSSTPEGGRKKGDSRLPNKEVVVAASINGRNDALTNERRVATPKCHMVPFGTSTRGGYVIDRGRGDAPGTWFPCARNNNFHTSANTHAEETSNLCLFLPVLSLENLNLARGVLDLIDYNIKAAPQDRVKLLDYFPHLERTSNACRGYPCLAVFLKSGPAFRILSKDGKTEIDAGIGRDRDNGILFVTHMDPDMMCIRSAQVIRYWDWIGTWPKRDKPFNAMIQGLIESLRDGTAALFRPGVGETLAYYNACIANQNPPSYIRPVSGLVDIASPNLSLPPDRGLVDPATRAAKPTLLDAYFYPCSPKRATPEQTRMLNHRKKVIKDMQDEPPSPPAYAFSPDSGDPDNAAPTDPDNAAPADTATTSAVSDTEEDYDRMYEHDFGVWSNLDADEEIEVETMVLIPSSDSDDDDDDGNAAPTTTATTPPVSDYDPEENEGVEVETEADASTREEDKEGDAPVSPVDARIVRTPTAELSDEDDKVEKAPVRRSSRIPVRRKKFASLAKSEHDEDQEEVKPARKPRGRSAAQKKGIATATASNGGDETPAAGRRMRTRSISRVAAAAVTSNVPVNVNEATKLRRTRSTTRSIAKGKAPVAAQQSNAVAGPGPTTAAMRGRKRVVSTSEAQKDDLPKQKKKRAVSRR